MEKYKYPRTLHLPWSLGSTSDDKFMHDTRCFSGETIIVTEKMDGENTSMYPHTLHARSMDSKHHESRNWSKGLWGNIRNEIPIGWRICGENLYAKHSLFYKELPTYFMVFSVWNDMNICLSWDDTLSICEMLGLATVPVIGQFEYNENALKTMASEFDVENKEGYVIRNTLAFHYNRFSKNVAKFVRAKHITTSEHWMSQKIVPNTLK